MSDELNFSNEAELNRYLFFSDLNDISFFVEDKDKEYEYETILSRLFGDKYRIAAIISAGGKQGVKAAFDEFGECDKYDSNRKNVYIVDGDFDRYVCPEEMIENPNFLYLKYYNIENYFIDKSAVLKFAKGKLHLLDKDVKTKVQYDVWKNTIVDQSKKLFLLYCAVQRKLPGVPNVARKEYLFIDDKTGFEKADAYKNYYDYIVEMDEQILTEVEIVKRKYEEINGPNYYGLICGKFLLISLFVYLKGICKCNFSKDELRWSLITDFDISSLKYIRERVDAICTKSEAPSSKLEGVK